MATGESQMQDTSAEPSRSFLSLCMIVKNERENLSRCLASAKPYVDEIIVVDTGSEDETPEIAASYGATVDYFEWCNDFAAARNHALSLTTGEWVLVLDADEALVVSDDFKQKLTSQPEMLAYSVNLTEAREAGGLTVPRLVRVFRNLPAMRYKGRFHEQLEYQGSRLDAATIDHLDGIHILHYGTTQAELPQENIERNIPILEAARQDEGLSLMLLYSLAGMYADTQQPEKAQECYSEAFDRLTPHLLKGEPPQEFGFVPSLLFILGTQALQQDDYETARVICQRGLEWVPSFPPLNYLAAILLDGLGFPLGSIAYFEHCLTLGQTGQYYTGEPFNRDYMTVYPACDLANLYLRLGQLAQAVRAFELALSFDPNCTIAQEGLQTIQKMTGS